MIGWTKKKSLIAGAALAVPVLLAAGIWHIRSSAGAWPAPATSAAENERQDTLRAVFGPHDPARIPVFRTGLENLPHSLAGTDVDGRLEADAHGHLKVTNDVRRVFDWFLSALGEEPLDVVQARLRAYIADRLPPVAAAEAEKILAAYLDYKQALAGLDAPAGNGNQPDPDAVRAEMAQVDALRSRYMAPDVVSAFFADDEAFDRYSLARMEVLQQKDLSPQQQAQQLAALEDRLPPDLQESVRTVNQYNDLQTLTAEWQQGGGSPAGLRQIRENLLGAAAADRLEALDAGRMAWNARMNAWYAERAAILGNAGLSPQDRAQAVDTQRAQRFGSDELLRVQTLERIHDAGGTTAMQGTPPSGSG